MRQFENCEIIDVKCDLNHLIYFRGNVPIWVWVIIKHSWKHFFFFFFFLLMMGYLGKRYLNSKYFCCEHSKIQLNYKVIKNDIFLIDNILTSRSHLLMNKSVKRASSQQGAVFILLFRMLNQIWLHFHLIY